MTEKHNKKFKTNYLVCVHITQGCTRGVVAEQQFSWPAKSELATKSAKIQEKGA